MPWLSDLTDAGGTYFPKVPSPSVLPISYFPTFFTMAPTPRLPPERRRLRSVKKASTGHVRMDKSLIVLVSTDCSRFLWSKGLGPQREELARSRRQNRLHAPLTFCFLKVRHDATIVIYLIVGCYVYKGHGIRVRVMCSPLEILYLITAWRPPSRRREHVNHVLASVNLLPDTWGQFRSGIEAWRRYTVGGEHNLVLSFGKTW